MKLFTRRRSSASLLIIIALSIILTTCLSEKISKATKRSSIPLDDYFEPTDEEPDFRFHESSVESYIAARDSSSRISLDDSNTDVSLKEAERLVQAVNGSRISGGVPAPFQIGVHTALVAVRSGNGDISSCTGTILDSSRILTAAHCFLERRRRFNVRLSAVRQGRFVGSGTTYAVRYINVFRFFHLPSVQNDVAIVWIFGSFKKPYKPVTLPPCTKCWVKPLTFVFAAGYGRTGRFGSLSSVIRQTQLRVRPFSMCKLRHFQITKSPLTRLISNARNICAMDPRYPKAGLKAVCPGDSGGPLYIKRPNGILQVGMSSFGSGPCGKAGTIQWFVNVASYVPFIKQYLNKKYAAWVLIYGS